MSEVPARWVDAGAHAIAAHRDQRGGGWERDEDVWLNYRIFAQWTLEAVLVDLQRQVEAKRDEAQAIVDDIGLPAAYVAKIRALAFAEIVGLIDTGGSDDES